MPGSGLEVPQLIEPMIPARVGSRSIHLGKIVLGGSSGHGFGHRGISAERWGDRIVDPLSLGGTFGHGFFLLFNLILFWRQKGVTEQRKEWRKDQEDMNGIS